MRSGYTTGTCAAAAVLAAAWHTFAGRDSSRCQVELPGGGKAEIEARRAEPETAADGCVWFSVKKDAGDDPDITDGALIQAAVEPLEKREQDDRGREREEGLWYRSEEYPFLFLTGGPGIGVVTRPGLACPPGFYAINPVPRTMIFRTAGQLYRSLGMRGDYLIRIRIPGGEALAEKTFNPKLGICGGLSVLGTSGIVRPMSEEALTETIRLEIHMRAAAGEDSLILVPGNYGERFLKENLGISPKWAVHCSNFVAFSIRTAVRENMKHILFTGHMGKLVKVAGGAPNTHSRYGDRRMEILAESLERTAGDPERLQKSLSRADLEDVKRQILACNTVDGAIGILDGKGIREPVMADVTERIREQMDRWSGGKTEIQVLTFSEVYGILGMSSRCGLMIEKWRKRQR